MRIIEDELTGDAIQELLAIHAQGMLDNSPEGSCHFLDLSGLRADDVTVWSIWDSNELAGCGALREIDHAHGEVKSMRTAQAHLGKKVGRQMLTHLIETAELRGYERLSLETGTNPSFAPAIHLYESVGFELCEPFDTYLPDPHSYFYTLRLPSGHYR